jgi:hypothetical protein
MKRIVSALVLSTVFTCEEASSRVIYGEDHRVEVYEATSLQKKLAQSAATLIHVQDISSDSSRPGVVQINQSSLKDWLSYRFTLKGSDNFFSKKVHKDLSIGQTFCEGERFIDQPKVGLCSGFLIAPDLLVTAGHCAEIENFCSDFKWVFGFEVNPKTKSAGVDLSAEDVYGCSRVVSSSLTMPLGLDYAVVKLDRKVMNRVPVEIRTSGSIELYQQIFVIGSPSGLPLKVASGANVRVNEHPMYFSANLDTFVGSSGSAVFSSSSGVVEGILVRGEEDFKYNAEKMCVEANRCNDDSCGGEEVTRITAIPEVALKEAFHHAASVEDLGNLELLLQLNIYVDFNTHDGVTALMKAAGAGKDLALKALLARGADPNAQDALGNTPLHHLAKVLDAQTKEALITLISANANLEIKNHLGQTPLEVAARSGNQVGVTLFEAAGAKKEGIELVAQQ